MTPSELKALRKQRRIGVSLIVVAFLALSPAVLAQETYTVSRVVDGDTIILNNGERVRLIGVDTPDLRDPGRNRRNAERFGIELEHYESYAQKAKDFVQELVEREKITLVFDPINEKINHRDKYGRLLAYVKIPLVPELPERSIPDLDLAINVIPREETHDEMYIDLNGSIVRSGHGLVYRRFDFKYKDEFLELEQEAKENRRGLWQQI